MATKIPLKLILSLFAVVVMVLVVMGFFVQTLFGGPEYNAARDIAELIDGVCTEDSDYVTTLGLFLPDSKLGLTHKEYFYIAVSDYKVLLRVRLEARDLKTAFADYLTQQPGERTIKELEMKHCKDKAIHICWKEGNDELCDNSFRFESSEGKELLSFTANRTINSLTKYDKVVVSYTRAASK